MKALILAAGRGSRMKHMTDETPKCLMQLKGKPLLEWQISALNAAGIDEIGIVTGYRCELLSRYGLREFHNARWSETNMVSSLECAEDWLANEPCIVSYSDIFYEPSAVSSLINCTATLAISYDPEWLALWTARFGDPLLDAETFQIDAHEMLTEIGSKPKTVEEIQGQYMGLLKFTPKAWAEITSLREGMEPAKRDRMHCTETLKSLISRDNFGIQAIAYRGVWGEVDNPEDLNFYSGSLFGDVSKLNCD